MDINIPSQVKTYANVGAFPATGSVKTIYIAEDTDIAYYWTGSAYQAISIQDLSGLVPYTGATTDVDLGNNDLNAEGIKIKGTAGNGHLNMKHQSSNPTAGGQETVVFAGADGEPRFKNDGNAVEQFASREWVNLQGFITNVITALGFTPVPDTRTVNGKALSSNITLTPSDIGSPSGSGTSSGTNTGDQTFITPRVQTVTSSATVTPTSTNDIVRITAQAEALTLANPTGTFLEGQSLIIRIKDNGTARTIGYGSDYRAIGVTLPTTTVINKTTYLGCIWNATDSKLDIIGVCTEV